MRAICGAAAGLILHPQRLGQLRLRLASVCWLSGGMEREGEALFRQHVEVGMGKPFPRVLPQDAGWVCEHGLKLGSDAWEVTSHLTRRASRGR